MAEFIYQMYRARRAHGDKVILDDVTMGFLPGAKIGVVGPNGMGKSTLLFRALWTSCCVSMATSRTIVSTKSRFAIGTATGSANVIHTAIRCTSTARFRRERLYGTPAPAATRHGGAAPNTPTETSSLCSRQTDAPRLPICCRSR